MVRLCFGFLLLLSLNISNAYASPVLSKQSIQKMLNSLSVSAQNKDSLALKNILDSKAKITLDLPEEMGGVIVLSAEDYTNKLEKSWSLPADYQYEITDINIILIGDATRAIVTDCVIESISLNGEILISTLTKERMMIELIDGKPKITEIYGVVAQN